MIITDSKFREHPASHAKILIQNERNRKIFFPDRTLLTIFVFNIQLAVLSNLNLVVSGIFSRQVGIQAETWMGRYNFWNLLLIKRI